MKTLIFYLSIVVFMLASVVANGQGTIPTKGKDFWIGFPRNPQFVSGAIRRCEVFITSTVSTSGTINIPAQGWSQTFNVVANQTTTINLPIIQVEHITSGVVENKGVQVLTNDTVSVFAISFQQYSADATIIYPKQSLGTEYRIASYIGLQTGGGSGPQNLNSDFLVVATEDNTQIKITPTAATLSGQPSGVPFTVSLNQGESYQVIASNFQGDFTGTVIEATDSSGSCRPFAVFSGAVCVNIPAGCTACDILYDQAIAVPNWGKVYYSTPFSFATKYTLRILADQNGTNYTVNGGAPVTLNAGQFTEINNITEEKCINSNKPINVIQYMQGTSCASSGDPSMMYLNSEDQKIDQVTFSTITSTIITQHSVNVIMETANISQLTLDGVPVPALSFSPFAACSNISYAQLNISQGSHTLAADSGFTAYSYGTGSAESYAYSVGSFSKRNAINIDSIICTNDTMQLSPPTPLFSTWWSTVTNPNDTIGVGDILTLVPPILPDIYIAKGNEFISGCERAYYFQVEVPTPPATYVTGSSVPVCQNQQVQLNAGTIPSSPVYQYTWTPAVGLSNPNIPNPVLTVSTSGWYKVAISSPSGCISALYDSTYIDVLLLPLPTVNAGNNQTICYGDSAVLSISGGVSYLWNPGSFTTNSITVSPISTTNYVVFLTGNNGCQNSDTVKVIVNQLPTANAGADVLACPGASTTLTATGGLSYLWTPGTSQNPFTVSPVTNTTYNVLVTGANGCQNIDSVSINIISSSQFNLGPDTAICTGNSVTLSMPAGGASYSWTPGGFNTNSITVSPTTTTTYIANLSIVAGCSVQDTITVTVLSIIANLGANQTICLGDSIVLTTAPGFNYVWSTNVADSTNSITVSPNSSTYYGVTITSNAGCQSSDSTLVTVNQLPTANAGADVLACPGASTTLTATGGLSYLWTPGTSQNPFIVSPVTNTTYNVLVTDANGCQNIDSMSVNIISSPFNLGPDTAICPGNSVTLSMPAGGASYSWTPGGFNTNSITVSPTTTTTYIANFSVVAGCSVQDTITVTVLSIIANLGANQTICLGDSIVLTTAPGFNYVWNTNGTDSTNSITVSPDSSTYYGVTISSNAGCQSSDSILVTVNQLPTANAGNDISICLGNTATLSAALTGIAYNWLPQGTNGATTMVSPSSTSSYYLMVTDNNGCKNYDTTTVTVNQLPIANAGDDIFICSGMSATLSATGGISYLWNPGNINSQSITVSPLVSTSYFAQVTDINGCINNDTAWVNITASPIADFMQADTICEDTPITLTSISTTSIGSIVYNYWTFGDGAFSDNLNPIHTFASEGNYLVQLNVLNSIGCADSIIKPVFVNPKPIVNFSGGNICVGEPVQFNDLSVISIGSLSQWVWSFGDGFTESMQNSIHIYKEAGVYDIMLTVTSNMGCAKSLIKDSYIEVHDLPKAAFSYVPQSISLLNPTADFIDQSIGSNHWEWNFGDGIGMSNLPNPTYTFSDSGTYMINLKVTNDFGCIDTQSVRLIVDPYTTLYIPNSFSPNEDGLNDLFAPVGLGVVNYEMIIFDRWGVELFNTSSLQYGWNGKFKNSGELCMQGAYVYKIIATDSKNNTKTHVGKVVLIR